MGLNTTPRTWVAGEKPPASTWNTEIRDALTGIQAAWVSYTPTWGATTTNPTLGTTTVAGNWRQIGKTVDARIQIAVGSSFTAGAGTYTFSLPTAALVSGGPVLATCAFFDSSASIRYMRLGYLSGASNVVFMDTAGAFLSATVPVAPAAGDTFNISIRYEAA